MIELDGAQGAGIDIQLERFGFYPAGGGIVLARGERRAAYAEAFVAGAPGWVASANWNASAGP